MSEKAISNEDMRKEVKKFLDIMKEQRKKWDSEGKTGFAYSCDLISESLTTLYIRLGKYVDGVYVPTKNFQYQEEQELLMPF